MPLCVIFVFAIFLVVHCSGRQLQFNHHVIIDENSRVPSADRDVVESHLHALRASRSVEYDRRSFETCSHHDKVNYHGVQPMLLVAKPDGYNSKLRSQIFFGLAECLENFHSNSAEKSMVEIIPDEHWPAFALHASMSALWSDHCSNVVQSGHHLYALRPLKPTEKLHSTLLNYVSPSTFSPPLMLPIDFLFKLVSRKNKEVTIFEIDSLLRARTEHFELIIPPSARVRSELHRSEVINQQSVEYVHARLQHMRNESVGLPPQVLILIATFPEIHRIELVESFVSLNNIATGAVQCESTSQTHPIWRRNITGQDQIIAVGDTGLDYDMCYFRDPRGIVVPQYPQKTSVHRKMISYVPCVKEDGSLEIGDKPGGHGTHVTGSATGNCNPGGSNVFGLSGTESLYNGLAKDAKLLFHDITCNPSDDLIPPGDLFEFFVPGYSSGARVHSNSWGNDKTPATYNAIDRRTDQFCADHPDMLVVFAAGNNPAAGVLSPAASKNVLTVGAHSNSVTSNGRNEVSSFSARGPVYDHRIKPEVLAPGAGIRSAASDGNLASNNCGTKILSGTSMATPNVAASAVLVRQYLTSGFYPSGKPGGSSLLPTSHLLKAMMIHSAHSVEDGAPSGRQGWGRIEIGQLLFFSDALPPRSANIPENDLECSDTAAPPMYLAQKVSLHHYQKWDVCVKVSEAGVTSAKLRATLAWIDAATAAEGSHRSVVNDLDLVISSNTGKAFYANGKTEPVQKDNIVEQIETFAAPGTYWVTVFGHQIVTRGQEFGLIVSAPGLSVPDESACENQFKCHNECSGHGTCTQGRCQCQAGYLHFDCSVCDAQYLCHGNGVCNSRDLSCTCGENFDSHQGPTCAVCKSGWYGPRCDSQCQCGTHGTCNTTSGVCLCDFSAAAGYWGGQSCDRCAPGRVRVGYVDSEGTAAKPTSPECLHPSTWCSDHSLATVRIQGPGWIQINDDPNYQNSMTCRYHLISNVPNRKIKLTWPRFSVESGFDTVEVFDGTNALSAKAAFGTGTSAPTPVTSTGESLFVVFKSDFATEGSTSVGFLAYYELVGSCGSNHSCSGHGDCEEGTICHCSGNFDPATDCLTCTFGWRGNLCDVHDPDATVAPTTGPLTSASTSTPAVSLIPTPSTTPIASVCNTGPGFICTGHGVCAQNRSACLCQPLYTGSQCEFLCPSLRLNGWDLLLCSGHGECRGGERSSHPPQHGVCDCNKNYSGIACQVTERESIQLVGDVADGSSAKRFGLLARYSKFATYKQWHRLPLPAPQLQLLVVEFLVELRTVDIGSQLTISLWNERYFAGDTLRELYSLSLRQNQSRATTTLPEGEVLETAIVPDASLCFKIVGWNRDPSRSSTLGFRFVNSPGHDSTPATAFVAVIKEYTIDASVKEMSQCPENRLCSMVAQQCPSTIPSASVMELRDLQNSQALSDSHLWPIVLIACGGGILTASIFVCVMGKYLRERAGFVKLREATDAAANQPRRTANVDTHHGDDNPSEMMETHRGTHTEGGESSSDADALKGSPAAPREPSTEVVNYAEIDEDNDWETGGEVHPAVQPTVVDQHEI